MSILSLNSICPDLKVVTGVKLAKNVALISISKWQRYGLGLMMAGLSGVILPAQAVILSDSSEQRLKVRSSLPKVSAMSTDSLQALIEQKQRDYASQENIAIEERKRISPKPVPSSVSQGRAAVIKSQSYETSYHHNQATAEFNSWLNSDRYRAQQVGSYQRYLAQQLGANNVPPLHQLLTTARSWEKCGYEPFQLPPEYLWANVVPTLKLYADLKRQGILPASTEIRSVYRSPALNSCAGGAAGSKHLTAGAIDIWVPESEGDLWQLTSLQEKLCQFWQYQGVSYDFGLGLYATGAIHLDTQGYRKWGFEHSISNFCRY